MDCEHLVVMQLNSPNGSRLLHLTLSDRECLEFAKGCAFPVVGFESNVGMAIAIEWGVKVLVPFLLLCRLPEEIQVNGSGSGLGFCS